MNIYGNHSLTDLVVNILLPRGNLQFSGVMKIDLRTNNQLRAESDLWLDGPLVDLSLDF